MPGFKKTSVSLTTLASTALLVAGQSATSSASNSDTTPLFQKRFDYPDGIPYQVDTDNGIRGTQFGYNLCNSTTEGQDSLCQTSFINSIDDFCLWAPPEPDSVVGNVEGEMVAWCTKPSRGTRVIPEGALKGVQFTRAQTYIQVVGFVDQTQLNIQAGDYGGEMDPFGADQRGNPLGGLIYSQHVFSGNSSAGTTNANGSWEQITRWHNFMGSDMFCLKACDPEDGNAYRMCEHVLDRVGCAYNAPADYANINGTFESCESDDQQYPGYYVGANGQTSIYTQPAESLGVITSIPYTAEIPATSQCTTYTSSEIYTSQPAPTSASAAVAVETSATETSAASSAAATSAASSSASAATAGVQAAAARPTTAATGAAAPNAGVSGSLAAAILAAVGFVGLAL